MAGFDKDYKVAAISPTGTGDQVGLAAVTNRSIVIWSLNLISSAATVVTLKNGSTAFSGPMSLPINAVVKIDGPIVLAKDAAFTIGQTVDGVDGVLVYSLA